LLPLLFAVPLAAGWLAAARNLELTSWGALIGTGAAGMAGYLGLAALAELGPRRLARRLGALVPGRVRGAALPTRPPTPHYSWPPPWSRETDGVPSGHRDDSSSPALEAPRPLTPR